MTSDKIHVALVADDNYFEGLLVTAWTIVTNCSRPADLMLYIIDGGISTKHFSFLLDKISSLGSTVCRIDASKIGMASFRQYHGSTMTYARLYLPDILNDVDTLIYSDVDILWHADIAELWNTIDHNAVLQYVPQHPASIPKVNDEEADWFRNNGYMLKREEYFCAGMIVMNLRIFRAERLHEKMLDVLQANNGAVPNNDQTVLNAFMFERTDAKRLATFWQIETSEAALVPDNLKFVLHYAEDAPWKTIHRIHHMLTDSFVLWHMTYASIRGITTRQSLKSCNSAIDILVGRALYLAASNLGIVRVLLRCIMILTGKKGGIPCLNGFMAKTNLRHLVPSIV